MDRRPLAGWGLCLALAGTPGTAAPQQGTDIYVGTLAVREGGLVVSNWHNATDREGYDNQPFFGPGGAFLLYTSGRADGQTEIFRYDPATGSAVQVTHTAESEYSPTIVPDGSGFSVVRVEADSTQRLWRFDMDGRNPSVVLENVMPVGYHAWGNARLLALFVLGSPATLQLADAATGRADVIENGIGRSLHRIPGQLAISFVHKLSDEEWWIKRLDLRTQEITPLVRTLEGSEDYAWTPSGTAVMGSGSILYQWRPGEGTWTQLADLAAQGIEGITRIAVSPAGDRIAVVGERQ